MFFSGLRQRGKKSEILIKKVLDRAEYFAHFLRPSQRTARKCFSVEVVLNQVFRFDNLVIAPQANK